ncbi:MAG: hypothetical protein JNK14_00260 [Chitinophagaceae bacterium]|nr:hypothetical protein [Chitinophagaceae bacterium]
MRVIITTCLLVVWIAWLAGCGEKKKPSLSGEEPVEVTDFIEFFPERNAPYSFADTTLMRKEKDSLLISYKVFTQFAPDSLLRKAFGKNAKPKLYPMSRIKGDVTYLFTKAVLADKRVAFVMAFDKKNQYQDGLPALQVDPSPATQQTAGFDKGYSITRTTIRKNADGSLSEGKDVYGLSDGKFSLIMTDALDDKITELINPIDTFSRKQKYTADYGSGKLNLVSIRDGRKKDRLTFFVHFDKNNGACTGELKGEAIIKSPNVAEYREGGDPCVLRFTFASSSVTLKEMEGCGVHRGLRCSFDGSFARKKDPPKPAVKKAKAKK